MVRASTKAAGHSLQMLKGGYWRIASVFIWPWKIGSADTLRRSPPQRNSTDSQA
ncbi:MAG: hypothetical protein AAGG53_00070 [Cyanobacteria bacterium P01_H01_bin.152]